MPRPSTRRSASALRAHTARPTSSRRSVAAVVIILRELRGKRFAFAGTAEARGARFAKGTPL